MAASQPTPILLVHFNRVESALVGVLLPVMPFICFTVSKIDPVIVRDLRLRSILFYQFCTNVGNLATGKAALPGNDSHI